MLSTAGGETAAAIASGQRPALRGRAAQRATGLHAGAWLAWLVAASAAVFLTSNPLYLATACLTGFTVYASLPAGGRHRAYRVIILVGVLFALLSIPFNLLTGSSGDTALFELPRLTFPDWLGGVTLGGDATAESLLYGGDRALRLIALLLFAAAFTVGVDHYRLLRLMPSAFRQMGVVITIAVLLIPQTISQARAVMEAQRLRGRRLRGIRGVAALAVPVLAGALERSIQRAESLDARGFGGLEPAASRRAWPVLLTIAGLGAAAFGAFAYFYYDGTPFASFAAMATGALLLLAGLRLQGGGVTASRYRDEPLLAADRVVTGCALLAAALLIVLRASGTGDMTYIPYPQISAPQFHPLGAAALLLLLAPGLAPLLRTNGRKEAGDD